MGGLTSFISKSEALVNLILQKKKTTPACDNTNVLSGPVSFVLKPGPGRSLILDSLGVQISIGPEADRFQRRLDFRVGHEILPDHAAAIILDHDHNNRLIKPHPNRVKPVLGLVEAVVEAVNAPDFGTEIAIEMLERGH